MTVFSGILLIGISAWLVAVKSKRAYAELNTSRGHLSWGFME